jgi:hypothetical protein
MKYGDAVLCKTESDMIFFQKYIKEELHRATDISNLIANKQYPLVFYIEQYTIQYSNLEFYIHKKYDRKPIDINILKRKEKLQKLSKF